MKVIYLKNRQKSAIQNDGARTLVEQISAEHGSALLRFIRVRSRLNPSDCEDVLQEVYERLLKVDDLAQKLQGRLDTVSNYLFQIATHLLIDRDRRAKVRQRDQHVNEGDVTLLSSLHNPERQYSNKAQLQQIQHALNELKAVHRQAFLLNRVDGKNYREISETLGVSVSTIEKYISTALLAIRARTQVK